MNAATTRPSQYSQPEQVLYVAFELSSRTWKLGMSVGFGQKARERNVPAVDLATLSEEIRLAKKRFGLRQSAPTFSCYEAGRDGFWIHRVRGEVMPGVISLPHGWGHDLPGIRLDVAARRPGANLNALLDENLRDPLSGNAALSGVPVRLEPENA